MSCIFLCSSLKGGVDFGLGTFCLIARGFFGVFGSRLDTIGCRSGTGGHSVMSTRDWFGAVGCGTGLDGHGGRGRGRLLCLDVLDVGTGVILKLLLDVSDVDDMLAPEMADTSDTC